MFTDKEMYAIPDESLLSSECKTCLCRMCSYLRPKCKSCYTCESGSMPRRKCIWFLPVVLGHGAYKDWFRELERIRGAQVDITDFVG